MKTGIILFGLLFFIIMALPFSSSTPFIVGQVNDALDGEEADGYIITMWKPSVGLSENLTDTVGEGGASGTPGFYQIDCDAFAECNVGDEVRVKIFNNGSGYVTAEMNLTINGSGVQAMENLTLNSPPNVSLLSPVNFANVSNSSVEFMCRAQDLDANLANVSLFGNWSGGWHLNQTLGASGNDTIINFTRPLSEGRYEWACRAEDDLNISIFSEQNYTLTVDLTAPSVISVDTNVSSVSAVPASVEVSCNVTDALSGVFNVSIEADGPSASTNYSTTLSGGLYVADVLIDEEGVWNFICYAEDYAGNDASLSSGNFFAGESLIDLAVFPEDITFSNDNPIEDEVINISVNVRNLGSGNADNFMVAFFEGDPDSGGIEIGNQTVSVGAFENVSVNMSWSAKIGPTDIYVYADFLDDIVESDENNNKNFSEISVTAWQEFYGEAFLSILLGGSSLANVTQWNESSSWNIFVADKEAEIDWSSLQAFGRNTSGQESFDDFSDLDSILSMTGFDDSILNTFTSGGSVIASDSFFIRGDQIDNVPILNSTNSSNFVTGMLWDTSSDLDGEFDSGDKEDVVFVTKVNKGAQGAYGVYDYEISIPVRLREYYAADTEEVFIYFDLN